MRQKRLYIMILTALSVQVGMAQAQIRDTLNMGKTHEIDEVVVTGTRNETDVRHLSQTVTVVDRSKIDRSLQHLPARLEWRNRPADGDDRRSSSVCRHIWPSDSGCLSVVPCRTGGGVAGGRPRSFTVPTRWEA